MVGGIGDIQRGQLSGRPLLFGYLNHLPLGLHLVGGVPQRCVEENIDSGP